jgi:hypothetical protein
MKKALPLLTLLCVVTLSVMGWAAPTVVNGSFEADTFSFGGTLGLGCGNTLTGWQTQCSADQIYPWGLPNSNQYGAGPTPYGNQWVIVGDYGKGGSGIFQTVTGFNIGQTYTLNFALASEELGAGALVQVSFPTGSSTGSLIFAAPIGFLWNNWGTYTDPFVATASSVTIRFDGLAGTGFDAGIDNVYITGGSTTPEPTTLVLLGSGLLGLAARRRKK